MNKYYDTLSIIKKLRNYAMKLKIPISTSIQNEKYATTIILPDDFNYNHFHKFTFVYNALVNALNIKNYNTIYYLHTDGETSLNEITSINVDKNRPLTLDMYVMNGILIYMKESDYYNNVNKTDMSYINNIYKQLRLKYKNYK